MRHDTRPLLAAAAAAVARLSTSPSGRVFVLTLSILAPIIVAVLVWRPHFQHYYVRGIAVPADVVERGRLAPGDALLDELTRFTPGYGLFREPAGVVDVVAAADKVLQGVVEVPRLPRGRIHMPFSSEDIESGSESWQLAFAGFTVHEVLLRAYLQTRDDRYLFAVRDMLVAWADYESRVWLPRGYMWNDHALARRVPVLATFWRVYRTHSLYDPRVARSVFELAGRSGLVLSDPGQFTFATNHGVMQNLALWHLSLAFPTLPNVSQYQSLALNRLVEQLSFYVSDEGVVLEHSPGYHKFGVELLGMAIRYLTLMDMPPPASWRVKYQRALDFYSRLRRPDGALPSLGDTDPRGEGRGPLVVRWKADNGASPLHYRQTWSPPAACGLYPVSGYAVWWQGAGQRATSSPASQTITSWSHFPGHGHKHADELSLSLWADGYDWLDNVGYWPYEARGRSDAESWMGSNAPHLVGEARQSERHTVLRSSGCSDDVAAIDLERRGPGAYSARRQIVAVRPNIWMVVDRVEGAPGTHSRTQWTTSPEVTMSPGRDPGTYRLRPTTDQPGMAVHLLGPAAMSIQHVRGSFDPFGGWRVIGGVERPASSLLVEQPADGSWAMMVLCLEGAGGSRYPCPAQRASARVSQGDDWELTLGTPPASVTISRHRSLIAVVASGDRARSTRLLLEEPPSPSTVRASIRAAYEEARAKYPRFRDIATYRLRATYGLGLLLGLQEGLFVVSRLVTWKNLAYARLAVLPMWAAVGIWMISVYLHA